MLYGNDVACAFKIVAHGLMVCDIHSIKRPLDNLNIPDFCLCCCCSDSGHRVKNVNLGKYTINVTASQDGQNVNLPVKTYATVGSVVLGKTTSDTKLNLLGYGEVSLDKVEQIAL